MSGSAPVVRAAREADLDALTELWERAARTSHGFMADEDFVDARPYVRDGLLPSMDVWIAECGHEVLGFTGVRDTHVELLYVEPAHHGEGVGSLLLEHVGPTSVEVYRGNERGLGFYLAHGFTPSRTHPHDSFGRPFPVVHLVRPAR